MLKYLSRIQQTVAFISAKSVTCVSLATNVRGKALPLWARSGLAAAQRVELKRVPEAAIRETQKFHPFQRRSQILGHSAVGSGRTTAWTGRTALSPKATSVVPAASVTKGGFRTFAAERINWC